MSTLPLSPVAGTEPPTEQEQLIKRLDAHKRCKAALTDARRRKDYQSVNWLENELKLIAFGAYG